MAESLVFENEIVKFEHHEGVVIGTFKKGPVTLEMAKEIVNQRLEFFNGNNYPLLITDVGLNSIKSDARSYLSSEYAQTGILASALLAKSSFAKHLANFFLKISAHKAKIPARVFSNEEDAIAWLSQYK